MKTVVYIGLENIKTNGVSDWLEKERTRLVTQSLHRKRESFNPWTNSFWQQIEGLRYSMEVVLSVAKRKDDCPITKIIVPINIDFLAEILLFNNC